MLRAEKGKDKRLTLLQRKPAEKGNERGKYTGVVNGYYPFWCELKYASAWSSVNL